MEELEKTYLEAKKDKKFQEEFKELLKTYCGRPTPLTFAKNLTEKLGDNAVIIGDDLLVTNKKRLQKAIDNKACNGIIIKPNQIGTLTETLEVIKLAQKNKIKTIISHRSGETNDDFIADLAVGVGADFVKFGAPARGERVIKYNKLLWFYHKFINNLISS